MASIHTIYTRKRAAALLIAVLLFTCLPIPALAADGESTDVRTVRLGYFDFQNYMLGAGEGTVKSGFAYDLLCDVAAINHWRYEFVYGDFNVLYEQLLRGEIDILPCLVYTEERAAAHLFSDEEIYVEQYFISVRNEDVDKVHSVADLDGGRLSSVTDCYQNTVFEAWAAEQGISMEFVCSDSFDGSWELLDDGTADFILNIDSASQSSGYTSLFEVGSGSSRFAIAPGREDIREELNAAVRTIYEINPFAVSHLKEKYLSATLSSYKLSEEEQAWLAGRDCIRIAGFADDMPYSYTDRSGAVVGVYPDAVESMFRKLGITKNVEWTLFDNEEEMHRALKEGRVDLVCPYYHGHHYAQTEGLIISEEFQSVNMGLLYGGRTREIETEKIAAPESMLNISYVMDNYPDAEIVRCPTLGDCIEAVAQNRADAAVAHVSLLQNEAAKYIQSYHIKTLVTGCPVCFAAVPENGTLLCIINRGLHLISDTELQALEIQHSPDSSRALMNYIRDNKLFVAAILLALVSLILFAIERNVASKRLEKSLEEITRQKEIIEENEKELEAAKEEANAANKAKSTFLFNMSHDIRTPMNAILGFSDRMLKHMDDPEIVAASAGKIKSSGEYLLSLINDVLDMARIESDKVTLDVDVNDIRERAYALCDVFEVNMQQKDLTFHVDFHDMQDTVVWYDSLKLRQIMLNLISNAVKYTPNGGTVTHIMHQVPCDKPGYGRYEIIVSDTGIGMTKEYVEHIFEQFSRSDDSITKETQGTGLGMSIVGRLVELMGGDIRIESEPGRGTNITVTLELKLADEEDVRRLKKNAAPEIAPELLEGIRILLVDDNELNREIAQEVLEDEGCIVADVAENGVIALGKVQNSPPGTYDVVLMDVQMPVMDGYEATRRIRALEDPALASIPILAMTANAFDEDRRDALAAGMNGHLAKPIEVEKLKAALAELAGKNK